MNAIYKYCVRIGKQLVLVLAVVAAIFQEAAAQHECTNPDTIIVHVSSGYINPVCSGLNFGTIFTCESAVDSIVAQNLGTRPLTVVGLDIIESGSPQFFFENGTQTLSVNILFRPNTKIHFPIMFRPSSEECDTATIRVTWDSAGVKKIYSENLLIGCGQIERDTLAPSQPNYTVQFNDTLNVPIDLTNELSANDNATGMSFQVHYPSDLLSLVRILPTDYNSSFSDYFAPQNFPGLIEFNLKSSTPITLPNPVVSLHFVPLINTDAFCGIALSDFSIWEGSPQNTVCHITTATKNASVNIKSSYNTQQLLSRIKIENDGDKIITISSYNLNLASAKIRVVSLLGSEISSWEGAVGQVFQKAFTVPASGPYYIIVETDGQRYFFKRLM